MLATNQQIYSQYHKITNSMKVSLTHFQYSKLHACN